ncbi:MAG: hypothetical protein R3F48_09660 [Candidatus Zixiibacteriota bacterium]
MKKLLILIAAIAALGLVGCDNDDDCILCSGDAGAPPVPQGVYSITGDGAVYIYWNHIDDVEGDFDYYIVYRSNHPDTGYWSIGETTDNEFVDDNVTNGQTYYYAVSSIDIYGHLSDLSYEYVFDTPRPEAYNQRLYDFNINPDNSGWDFSGRRVVAYNSIDADFYVEYYDANGVFYINVSNIDTDIQDMGYTSNLDEVNYSPTEGWSQLGWVEVIAGHTYIIWTDDNHFAKVRVTAVDIPNNSIVVDWAYQVDTGNPELKPAVFPKPKIDRPDNYLRMANEKTETETIGAL